MAVQKSHLRWQRAGKQADQRESKTTASPTIESTLAPMSVATNNLSRLITPNNIQVVD
jgi:hypothetical protein